MVAGLDASLATMIGAMTDVPVVAVPTSTGQPSAFGGLGALMTMLNSAAPGVVVSNIDNGYSAGVFAARVARRSAARAVDHRPCAGQTPADTPHRAARVDDQRPRCGWMIDPVTIGWLDLAAGRPGDMLLGALVDAGVPLEVLAAAVAALPVEQIRLVTEQVTRHGLGATRVHVHAPDSSHHRTWPDVRALLAEADARPRRPRRRPRGVRAAGRRRGPRAPDLPRRGALPRGRRAGRAGRRRRGGRRVRAPRAVAG